MNKEELELEIKKQKLKIGDRISVLNALSDEIVKGLGQLEELNKDLFYPPALSKRINNNKHITKLCDISIRNLKAYKEQLEFVRMVNNTGNSWDITEYAKLKNDMQKGMNNIQCVIYDIDVEYLSAMANINYHLRNRESDKISKRRIKKGR